MQNNSPYKRTSNNHKHKQQVRLLRPEWGSIYEEFKKSNDDYNAVVLVSNSADVPNSQKAVANEYILRTRIIMASSAFDRFMHEMLYKCLLDMRDKKIEQNNAYKDFNKNHGEFSCKDDLTNFYSKLEKIFGKKTLSSFYEWSCSLSYFDIKLNMFAEILMKYLNRNLTGELATRELKTRMKRHSDRRNKIAHCYDFDMETGEQKTIDEDTVNEYVRFINALADSINTIILEKWN